MIDWSELISQIIIPVSALIVTGLLFVYLVKQTNIHDKDLRHRNTVDYLQIIYDYKKESVELWDKHLNVFCDLLKHGDDYASDASYHYRKQLHSLIKFAKTVEYLNMNDHKIIDDIVGNHIKEILRDKLLQDNVNSNSKNTLKNIQWLTDCFTIPS